MTKLMTQTYLTRKLSPNLPFGKIALPTMEGSEVIDVRDIICCEAEGNYSRIILAKSKILIAKSLKWTEAKFAGYNFFRTHRHHLVNMDHFAKYLRGKQARIKLDNGNAVRLSVRAKKKLLPILNGA